MEEREKIARLQEMVDQSHSIVFFGGAGVSTENGSLVPILVEKIMR